MKINRSLLERCVIIAVMLASTVILLVLFGKPLTMGLQLAGFVAAIFVLMELPIEHPYGYKGDWYGYHQGMKI